MQKKKDSTEPGITESASTGSPAVKQETPITPASTVATPQPKTTTKPVGAFKDLNFNDGFRLKQTQAVVDPNKAQIAEEKVVVNYSQPFTLEQLQQSVIDYTKKMQEQGKKQIAVMLRPDVISLNNQTEILIDIENKAQIDGFEPMKQDFLDFVRKGLNNQNITLKMQEKVTDPTKRAYSPSEKFETMLIKNPALLALKNRLGMELDY